MTALLGAHESGSLLAVDFFRIPATPPTVRPVRAHSPLRAAVFAAVIAALAPIAAAYTSDSRVGHEAVFMNASYVPRAGVSRPAAPSGRMARFLKSVSAAESLDVDSGAAMFTPPGTAHRGASTYRTGDGAVHDVKYDVSILAAPSQL